MKTFRQFAMQHIAVGPRPHRIDALEHLQSITVIRKFPHHVRIRHDFAYFDEVSQNGMEDWLHERGLARFDGYVQAGIFYLDGDITETAFAFRDEKVAVLFKLMWG